MASLGDYAKGVLGAIAENTIPGRILLEPMDSITTNRERALAMAEEDRAFQQKQRTWMEEDRNRRKVLDAQADLQFQQSQEDRKYRIASQQYERAMMEMNQNAAYRQQAEQDIATAENGMHALIADSVTSHVGILPDAVMQNVLASPQVNNLVDISVAARLFLDPAREADPAKQRAYVAYLERNRLVEEDRDGKTFLVDLDTGAEFDITADNFNALHNEYATRAAKEVAARIKIMEMTKTLSGRPFAAMAQVRLSVDPDQSVENAMVQTQSFLSQFTPSQLRTHYLVEGLTEFFDDQGAFIAAEGGDLAAQMQYLAQAVGVQWEMLPTGEIQVKTGGGLTLQPDGTYKHTPPQPVSLKMFYDDLKARDVVGQKWQEEATRIKRQSTPMYNYLDTVVIPLATLAFDRGDKNPADVLKDAKETLRKSDAWDSVGAEILGVFDELDALARPYIDAWEAKRRAEREKEGGVIQARLKDEYEGRKGQPKAPVGLGAGMANWGFEDPRLND